MALHIETGIVLKPSEGEPPDVVLPLTYYPQKLTNWCWAACCQMIFGLVGAGDVSQCDMATFYANNPGDGGAPPDPLFNCCKQKYGECNRGHFPDRAYTNWHVLFDKRCRSLNRVEIVAEIGTNKCPIECYLNKGGTAHVVLIGGYYKRKELLLVLDPSPQFARRSGLRKVTLEQLEKAFGQGSWEKTYLGFHLGADAHGQL